MGRREERRGDEDGKRGQERYIGRVGLLGYGQCRFS